MAQPLFRHKKTTGASITAAKFKLAWKSPYKRSKPNVKTSSKGHFIMHSMLQDYCVTTISFLDQIRISDIPCPG